jgi:hypothetical protein
MPNDTPFGPLESLVGRTFKRRGRPAIFVEQTTRDGYAICLGDDGSIWCPWVNWFALYLSGAKEVTP